MNLTQIKQWCDANGVELSIEGRGPFGEDPPYWVYTPRGMQWCSTGCHTDNAFNVRGLAKVARTDNMEPCTQHECDYCRDLDAEAQARVDAARAALPKGASEVDVILKSWTQGGGR